jgi:2-polyprenyl-3-methyl-5-hydroxy-6-metoxy-1,4-benzoquinol methylase
MNVVDVLLREDTSTRASKKGLVAPAERRSAPTAVQVLLPVWGYQYVRQFLELGLPTLLAPGNVPALAKELPTKFVILTSAEDEPFIREHRAFKRLAAACDTDIRLIDHFITDGNYSTTLTLAYTEAVRLVGDAMIDTCFFFLVSDYIVAEGSLLNALKRMQRGTSAILVGNFQVAREEALPWLQEKAKSAKDSIVLPPRELMQWALNHLHPTMLANMVNFPFSHNSHTNRLFWRVDGGTILGRFYLMHMLCVRPEITDFVIGASCDYSFVPEMCPSGNVEAITDSDDYLVIEMQPRTHEASFLRSGPLKPAVLAKSLTEWTTSNHRDNARHTVIFHADDVPAGVNSSIDQADAFVETIARAMKRAPLPYRGHPYWRGAMAAFHDATGRKIEMNEWRYALGLPEEYDWLTEWLIWRAKYMIMGRPPYVLPWHTSWPDFQIVLKELESFFIDPNQHLLMLSNTPTVFTLALTDSGERVHRIRCTPFMENLPERYDPLLGHFDICLLELSEIEMSHGDELIDRIVPLMKTGGRIIVSIRNQRPLGNAREFGNSVSFHASRFFRSGGLPTEFYFVPSSMLRWMAHRGMFHLRRLMNKGAWLSLPILATAGSALLGLSLLGNLDSLRRTRRMAPRGIASSFVMRLIVDAPRDKTSYVYSRFTVERKRRVQRSAWVAKSEHAEASQLSGAIGQYNRCVELKNTIGLSPLGLMTNQVWYDDPRRLTFLLARYKFVAKMFSGRHNVGEVGCGDAFGTRIVMQEVPDVTVYDFDPLFIEDIRARQDERWPLKAHVHDIVAAPLPFKHEAIFSLDVIEHIAHEDEDAYLTNLRGSLAKNGVLIIGTPLIEPQAYALPPSNVGQVNHKSGNELKALLEQYFSKVFLFSMNDEVVHTGFYPMANYLFAICIGA